MEHAKGLIVIDGSDGTGKTTLANHFVKRYGAVHMHQTYRFKDRMFTFHTARLIKALKLAQTRLVVMDRLWMSEEVYAKVYRGGTPWPHEGRFIDRVLLKHAALQIITTEPADTYAGTFARVSSEREEMWHGKPEQIASGYFSLYNGSDVEDVETYADHLRKSGGMCKRHDTMDYTIANDGQDMDGYTDKAIMALNALRANQYGPCLDFAHQNTLGYAGTSDIIFVSDADMSNRQSRHISWPFYDYGHSSLYMAQALHSISFDETKAMWTNIGTEGIIHVAEMLRHGHKKIIIALGKNASNRLNDAGISIEHVYHPSYAKRVMRLAPEEYGCMIERAIADGFAAIASAP